MSLDIVLKAGTSYTTVIFTVSLNNTLQPMAEASGLYAPLWTPEEPDPLATVFAKGLIKPLRKGLVALAGNPSYFKTFAPDMSGYHELLKAAADYLCMCEEFPEGKVSVSR